MKMQKNDRERKYLIHRSCRWPSWWQSTGFSDQRLPRF